MNQYEFILGIVYIMMIASVIKTISKHNAKPKVLERDPEADRLRDEVKVLKDRIAVLERIATDKSVMLDREIEELRHR
jgi:hypothetical protein